jgi:hypothetical protein
VTIPPTLNLHQARQVFIAYAQLKLAMEDWHGVRDVCTEIEVIEARIHASSYNQPNTPPGQPVVADTQPPESP